MADTNSSEVAADAVDRRSIEEHEARVEEIKTRMQELDHDYAGRTMSEPHSSEWTDLDAELDREEDVIEELHTRRARLEEFAERPAAREPGAHFHVQKQRARGDDIWDLTTVRSSVANPEEATVELRDRAKRAIEQGRFPSERISRETAQTLAQRTLDQVDDEYGSLSRRYVVTGSPTYKRAFGKYLAGQMLTADEQRSLSLTGASGGFAVPFELDPSIIPTSNLAVNPYRSIARVIPITVDEWRGVSSAGITAAYAAEGAAASDNAPTVAQPTISTERAQAYVPYSIEVGMDWSSLQAEMARLLQDAKDELEAVKFTLGSGTNEPFGVITGATTITTTVGTAAFVVADLYALEAALGPRFRPRASAVMNRFVAQKIRQFDTAGGASIWIDNLKLGLDNQVPTPGSYGAAVLGYPTYESSAMDATLATGSEIIVLGDFSYFVIVDRVGLTVEAIPHIFNAAGTLTLPTGMRGLYAYWRNGSKVVDANAFRTLRTL